MSIIALRKKYIYEFGIGLCLIIALGYVSFNNLAAVRDATQWIQHTNTVIRKLDKMLYLVKSAESSQRNYLMTGDHVDLDDYIAGTSEIPSIEREIQFLTTDNPVQQENIKKLKPIITQRVELLKKVIEVNDSYPQEAIKVIKAGKGRFLMSQIKSKIDEMSLIEEELLRDRLNKQQTIQDNTLNMVVFVCIISIVIIFGAISFASNICLR